MPRFFSGPDLVQKIKTLVLAIESRPIRVLEGSSLQAHLDFFKSRVNLSAKSERYVLEKAPLGLDESSLET